MTICKENLPYLAESIIELEKMGLIFTANLVFEDIWGSPDEKKRLLYVYENQLDQLVDFYSKNPSLAPVGPILTHAIEAYNHPLSEVVTLDSDCVRYCGAGHEMIMIDIDGSVYPCHRFAPWVTGKTAPEHPINRQQEWGPEKCSSCKLLSVCPTCAGFNWQINGDTGIRTTYHCEAFKLEFLASAKLHAIRMGNFNESKLRQLSEVELGQEKARLEVIFSLINEGI